MKRESYFTPAVLDYVRSLFGGEDPVLEEAGKRAEEAGLPMIQVGPEDGALLAFLVRAVGAVRVVEIGTLFGYSAIWMARALPAAGHLYTVEKEPDHAALARENVAAAGLVEKVTVLEGEAPAALAGVEEPVDLVFIDADKVSYPKYLAWARDHLRPGGLVAADNAFLKGRIGDPGDREPEVEGMRQMLEELARDPAWTGAMIPTLEGMAVGVRA